MWKNSAIMQCLDDKAIVPVGEPEKPVSACGRKHHGGLVVGEARTLLALDHDYNMCGLVPSVCLMVDIPSDAKGSFYRGDVHITVKENVLQPSSPMRHASETAQITRPYSQSLEHGSKPILLRYTDGGPDHRTTYKTVQLSAIAEFISLDLDMLIACRTAPNQSYNNPAERVMSLLNLGLQNVSLSRTPMDLGHELKIKNLNSLKTFRSRASDSLKDALTESMMEPMNTVKDIFPRLNRSHGSVNVHDASTKDEIDGMSDPLKAIDPDIKIDCKYTSVRLETFVEKHCRARHYSFQIKKCDLDKADSCDYCSIHKPKIPSEEFVKLTFLPDPMMDKDAGCYKDFNSVLGTPTTDSDMSSKLEKPVATERDKKFKKLLKAEKVRNYVICHECGKRRVVYSAAKLTQQQERSIAVCQDQLLYSCGNCLFPGGSQQDTIIVREGLHCSSPVETQYYGGITQIFEEICFFCGDIEVDRESEEVNETKRAYAIVRPICSSCLGKGLKPSTRNAKKLMK